MSSCSWPPVNPAPGDPTPSPGCVLWDSISILLQIPENKERDLIIQIEVKFWVWRDGLVVKAALPEDLEGPSTYMSVTLVSRI